MSTKNPGSTDDEIVSEIFELLELFLQQHADSEPLEDWQEPDPTSLSVRAANLLPRLQGVREAIAQRLSNVEIAVAIQSLSELSRGVEELTGILSGTSDRLQRPRAFTPELLEDGRRILLAQTGALLNAMQLFRTGLQQTVLELKRD